MSGPKAPEPRKRFTDHDIYRMSQAEQWANTTWLVEGTHEEQMGVWLRFNERCELWKSGSGWLYTVGHLTVQTDEDLVEGGSRRMPVTVEVTFVPVDGHVVCFYEAASRIVDHDMVRAYVEGKAPHASHTNATNFHHVIHGLGVELKEVRK